ncbi:MAG: DUF3098 domain-containing protein [Rikenellaceae bacterium]
MTFHKKNYILILISILLIVLGFILLAGGGAENPVEEFSYEIYSVRRLWIAPIVLVAAFVLAGVAIFKRFKNEEK